MNEKSFSDEIKNIHHFQRVFIEAIKTKYFWKARVWAYFINIRLNLEKP